MFRPDVRHRRTAKSLGNRIIFSFRFSAFQRNAQPLPTAMISGVWGHVTNKRFRRFSEYGKSAKMSLLYKKALLAGNDLR